MAYRKTRRSKETLARMKAGKDAARMARPAPDYPPERPELRRRIVIESFDFGHDMHVMELYRTSRIDCFRVMASPDREVGRGLKRLPRLAPHCGDVDRLKR